MPKKLKKIKSKKGKKKKGKGKDCGIQEHDILKEAIANAYLWENRLNTTVAAKNEYRENTRNLLRENEQLQIQVAETEKDTIDVISFLKDEDIKKDGQICKLQAMVKELKKEYRKDKDSLINEFTSEIEKLHTTLADKTNEIQLMQSELKLVKEFRRKRANMQKELDEIKNNLFATDKKHKTTLEIMERKFFEERIRLQQEASRKISELAEKAHMEAVINLDETTKSIYLENVRLNEALNYHVRQADDLTQTREQLMQENRTLKDEKEMNSLVVEEKVIQVKNLQRQLKEVRSKVSNLEHTLTQVIKEHETEKQSMKINQERHQQHEKMEIARLQRTIELKTKEGNRIRKLAKTILEQRSEMEQFFMESLEIVKSEIIKNRSLYQRDAEAAYRQRMLQAHAGQSEYPKIRTFKNSKFSTNSIFSDFKEAEKWDSVDPSVDISDLTWEQREKIIRLMFASMNGTTGRTFGSKIVKLPPIKNPSQNQLSIENTPMTSNDLVPRPPSAKTFLTETENVIADDVKKDLLPANISVKI